MASKDIEQAANNTGLVGPEELEKDARRKAYLITYSRGNTEGFDRKGFADAVIGAFKSVTKSVVLQWCCCLEGHKNGAKHFHMCILLDKPTRRKRVREYLHDYMGVAVNFSGHGGYYSLYLYVLKEDKQVLRSEGHPDRIDRPKTAAASEVRTRRRQNKHKLSKIEVADIIIQHKIENRVELLRLATQYRKSGASDLYLFCIERSSKPLVDFIGTVWDA